MGSRLKLGIGAAILLELAVLGGQISPKIRPYEPKKDIEKIVQEDIRIGISPQTEEDSAKSNYGSRPNYTTKDFSRDSDEILLARMIYGEGRGSSRTEQIAIGFVAQNRTTDGKPGNGRTLREVILKSKKLKNGNRVYQFSAFNPKDPNRKEMLNPSEIHEFENCLSVARDILSQRVSDPTNGATHYFNPSVTNPNWANSMYRVGRINTETGPSDHEFYIDKK